MAAYLDLLPEVLPDVPGCSDPLAERAVRNAVIRLCEGSDVLKHSPGPTDLQAGAARYAIQAPAGHAFHQVMWVTIDGRLIKQSSSDYLDLAWTGRLDVCCLFESHQSIGSDHWRALTQARPEVYFLERDAAGDYLRLVGIPTANVVGALAYEVSLKPTRAASEFAGWLAEDYYRTIAKGALAELLRIPKKAWTDTARGVTLEQEFDAEVGEIKASSLKDFTRDDQANLRTRAYT